MFTFQRRIFYFCSRQTAPNNRSRLQSTPASANINNKNQHTVAVVNITDDSMFKDQELETGVENDKPKQTPQESERIRKAKEEEDRYKKELETLQLEYLATKCISFDNKFRNQQILMGKLKKKT